VSFDFRDEAQVLKRAKKAVPNRRLTWLAALAAKQHRYAIEYIEQAPVLVLGATFGKPLKNGSLSKEQLAYVANRFRRIEGMKLKEAMKEFHLPYPLRKLRSTAVAPAYAEAIWGLRNVPPSALSQAIPDKVHQQQMWLNTLRSLRGWAALRSAELPDEALYWFVSALGVAVRESRDGEGIASNAHDLVDLFVSGRFNYGWTFEEAVTAHRLWAAEVAKRDSLKSFFATYGVDLDYEVDFTPQPNDVNTIDGMDVIPLRSGEALITEGALMRHCVSTYMRDILAARSCIYSLQKDGKRVATLELSSGDRPVLKQLNGPCNARVTPDIESVMQKFIASIAAQRVAPIDKLKRLFETEQGR
jgi:hypothetical protein